MRRVLVILFTAALGGSAAAADLARPYVKAPPPPYALPFSWTGTYVGGNLGGVWGTFSSSPLTVNNLTLAATSPGSVSVNGSSVVGGAQAGYNWQIGQWVLGV